MRRIAVFLVDLICLPIGWAIDRAADALNDREEDR